MDFSPNGQILASGASEHVIFLWNVANVLDSHSRSEEILPWATLKGHSSEIASVRFAQDGQTLLSSGWDGTVRLWQVPSKGEKLRLKCDYVLWISGDGKDWITVKDDRLYRWQSLGADQTPLLNAPSLPKDESGVGHAYWQMAFSPDGKTLMLAKTNGFIEQWDLEKPGTAKLIAHDDSDVEQLQFTPDGSLLIRAHQTNGIRITKFSAAMEEVSFLKDLIPHFEISHDGKTLAARHRDEKHVELWDLAQNRSLGAFPFGGDAEMRDMALSPHGRLLAGRGLELLNLATREVRSLPMPPGALITPIAFAPDGKTLVACTMDNDIVFWNLSTGEEMIQEGTGRRPIAGSLVVFSPNGEWLALRGKYFADGQKSVIVWHAPSLKEIDARRSTNQLNVAQTR